MTFAADSPNSDRTAFITSNNTLEGTGAADAVAEAMGGKGEYAVLENPGQDNHDLRISSFIGRMEAKWPDMKLVARAASNQDPNKAYQAVLSMAQANPESRRRVHAGSQLGSRRGAGERRTRRQDQGHDVPTSTPRSST